MNILVTQERVEQHLTVGEYLDLRKGDIDQTIQVMAKFILGEDGQFLLPEDGLKAIRALKFSELNDVAMDFAKKVQEGLVPPTKGEATAEQG